MKPSLTGEGAEVSFRGHVQAPAELCTLVGQLQESFLLVTNVAPAVLGHTHPSVSTLQAKRLQLTQHGRTEVTRSPPNHHCGQADGC